MKMLLVLTKCSIRAFSSSSGLQKARPMRTLLLNLELLQPSKLATNRNFATVQQQGEEVGGGSEVFVEKSEGIATLTLNRIASRNALSGPFVQSLRSQIRQLKLDQDIRVLIVRSLVPGVFCAGADLKERLNMPLIEVGPFVDTLRSMCTEIEQLDFPTVAALDGAALGGGLEIALSCDLRVVSATAKLGLVETKLAIIPGAGGTQRLPRLIGPAKAKELIFTGRVIDGLQAYNLGIANMVVDQNKERNGAYLRSLELAQEIASQGPLALRAAKKAINDGLQVDIRTGMDIEGSCYQQVIPTQDRMEGLRAFIDKRPPVYKGR